MALSLNEVLGTPNSNSYVSETAPLALNPLIDTSSWNQGQPNNPVKKSAIKNPNALTDSIINLGQGALKLPGEVAGLGDVAAGLVGFDRPFGKAADYLGDKTGLKLTQMANDADKDLSPELRTSKSNIDKAWEEGGAGNIASAYAKNPRASVSNIFESLPMMAASGLVGKGAALALPALADTVAAGKVVKSMASARYALGDAALTAGDTMSNIDQNVDPQKAAVASLADGAFTGAIDLASGKLANHLGLENMGNLAAGQGFNHAAQAEAKNLHPALRIGGGAALESGEEILQNPVDQLAQNAAESKPWDQGLSRAAVEGGIAGMGMGFGANAMSPGTYFQPVLNKRTDRNTDTELDTGNVDPNVTAEQQADRQRQADDLTQKAKDKEAKNAGQPTNSTTEAGVVADTGGTTGSVDNGDTERIKDNPGEAGEQDSADNLSDKASLIVKANGEPYASESIAKAQLAIKGLTQTHGVVPHDGGFALKPNTIEEPSGTDSTDHPGANGVDAAGVDASGSQDKTATVGDTTPKITPAKTAEVEGSTQTGGNEVTATHELSDGTKVIQNKDDQGNVTGYTNVDDPNDEYSKDEPADVLKANAADLKTKTPPVPVPAGSDKAFAPESNSKGKLDAGKNKANAATASSELADDSSGLSTETKESGLTLPDGYKITADENNGDKLKLHYGKKEMASGFANDDVGKDSLIRYAINHNDKNNNKRKTEIPTANDNKGETESTGLEVGDRVFKNGFPDKVGTVYKTHDHKDGRGLFAFVKYPDGAQSSMPVSDYTKANKTEEEIAKNSPISPAEQAAKATKAQLPSPLYHSPNNFLDGAHISNYVRKHVKNYTKFPVVDGSYYLDNRDGEPDNKFALLNANKAIHKYGMAFQTHLIEAEKTSKAKTQNSNAQKKPVVAKDGDSLVDENGENQWVVKGDVHEGDDNAPAFVTTGTGTLGQKRLLTTVGQIKDRQAQDKAFRETTHPENMPKPEPIEPATHIEGDGIERVTLEVVDELLEKAADNTPKKTKKEMRNWLIDKIDEAIETAHSVNDEEVAKTVKNANATGSKVADRAAAQKHLKDWLIANYGYVTFDVPGDGKFKVLNTKTHLQGFKRKVLGSAGFKETKDNNSDGQSNNSPQSVVNEFLKDGEFANAYQAAQLAGTLLGYGVGSNGRVLVYSDIEDLSINGRKMFVGRHFLKSEAGKQKQIWCVVDRASGLSGNQDTATKDKAIASAKDRIATMAETKGEAAVDEMFKKAEGQGKTQEQLLEKFKEEHLKDDGQKSPEKEANTESTETKDKADYEDHIAKSVKDANDRIPGGYSIVNNGTSLSLHHEGNEIVSGLGRLNGAQELLRRAKDLHAKASETVETPLADLKAELRKTEDELKKQGVVKNADTMRTRDRLKGQIAEIEHPEIYKAVDKTVAATRIAAEIVDQFKDADNLKNRLITALTHAGYTDAYSTRWAEKILATLGKTDKPSVDETLKNKHDNADVSAKAENVDIKSPADSNETKPAEKSPEYLKAKADLDEALGDLGEVFLSANLFAKKAVATQISAKDLIPVLTRVMDAAFRMGYADFKANAKFVLDTIREKFGDPAADSITIGHLQGSYIAMGDGTTLPKDVVNFTSIDQLNSPDQENNDASADDKLKDGNSEVQNLGAVGTEEIPGGRRGSVASNGHDNKTKGDEGVLEGESPQNVPETSSYESGGQSDPSAGMQDAGSGRKKPEVGDSVAGQQEPSGTGLAYDGTGERGQPGEQRVSDKDKALVDGDIQTKLGNYHITDPESLIGGTPKVRFARNKKAIESYQIVTEENREPTEEERDAIAAYIGWGSFGQDLFQGTFDRPVKRDGWDAEGQWLREHLGESAWKSAQASIINAHYTDPPTVKALWAIAQKLGFTGGKVLEPSLGIGNFFGLMPPDLMERSSLTGIELDETTGGMAKMLYPDANIQVKGYQESKTADGFYDLVIGNWPFAEKAPSDRRYNKLNLTLHDYFFAKTLDQVRPGGLVIGITSAGTMDKVGKLARLEMAKKGILIAAFRMPMGAFDKYAGTSVVADIIILQKHGEGVAENNGETWKEIEKLKDANGKELTRRDGSTVNVNRYWAQNPDNVLGKMTVGHGSTTFRDGMIVQRQDDYAEVLDKLADRLPANIMSPRSTSDNISYITNNTKDRQNSVVKGENGKLYIVQGDRLALLDDLAKYTVKDKSVTENREDQLNRLVDMRKAYGELIDAERAGNENTEELRKELNKQYQAFVKMHGVLNESQGLKILNKVNDPFFPALAALENNTGTKENPVYTPARILTKPTMRGKSIPDNPSVVDAFIQARNENADFIDVNRIAELSKTPVEQVVKELTDTNALFKTPSGNYEVGDVYLSGNVRQKMREAIDAQESGQNMTHNIAALKKVIPKDTPYFAIEASLGANWVGAKYYQQFIADLLGVTGREMDDIDVQLMPKGWRIKMESWLNAKPEAKTIWGVSFHPFSKIVNAAFNGGLITIRAKDADGTVFVDEAATKQANEKVDALREEFKNWVWKDAERRVVMEKAFNETMNAFATPHYDGSFMSFVGMALQKGKNEFSLRKHQIDAIWRGVANGRGLFAHEVGTGKTYTMGGIAVESRRYGIAKKPIIFAHNANSASVASDIQGMYPGAKILYIDNLAPAMIKQRMYQIANDDWDAVVVPHSLLDRFALTRETLMRIAERDIMALEEEAIASAAEEGFDIEGIMDDEEALRKVRGATTAKQLVKERNRIINEINKMSDRASREDSIAFEQLGIDMIIVDEAHEFKKPPISTRLRVKGLNTSASSNGIAMHLLTTYIRDLNNGKGVHTFTGTPITNTLNEIYNQMRYVMGDTMDEAGVSEWDSWFNTFASKVSDVELTPTGEYEAVTKLTAFNNVAELRRFAGQYMDIVFADEMPEFVSRATESGKTLLDNDLSEAEKDTLINGRTENPVGRPYKKVVNETAPMTPVQRGILSDLVQLARMFKNASRKDRRRLMIEGHPSSPVQVETNAAKAGFDARLYDLEHSDDPENKINRCIINVIKHYHEHDLATQVIFMDKGYNDTVDRERSDGQGGKTKTRHDVFNAAKDIVNKLVAQGIPKEQIAVVTGATTKEKRKEIADNMNSGKIRVVIGGTQTLGVGVNMQDNLRAMHHLDAPWMPGELEQRNGRGHRQGNKWNTVMEYRYLTEGIDGRRWQVLAIKQKFITAFLKADEDTRTIEGDAVDLSEADGIDDISASLSAAAGDPRLMMREKLRGDVNRLENRQRTHDFGIADAIDTAHRLKRKVELLQEKSAKSTNDAEHYAREKEKPFSIEVRSKIFTDRKDVDEALIKAYQQAINGGRVGLFMDFEILRQGDGLVLRRKGGYSSSLSLRSIEANLRNIGKHVENDNKQIEELEQSIRRMNQAAKTPFGMAAALEKKRAMLAQLVNDLSLYPAPAPSWLRNGSPVGTDVYIRVKSEEDDSIENKKVAVQGHRWGNDNWYVLVDDGKGEAKALPYTDIMDENNTPIYEARDFEKPVIEATNPNPDTNHAPAPATSSTQPPSTPKGIRVGDTVIDTDGTHYHVDRLIKPDNDTGRESDWGLEAHAIDTGDVVILNAGDIHVETGNDNDNAYNDLSNIRVSSKEELADAAIARVIQEQIDKANGLPSSVKRVVHAEKLRKIFAALSADEVTKDEALNRIAEVYDEMVIGSKAKAFKSRAARVRGKDFVQQKLLEAKRRGHISEEESNFSEWFVQQNPGLIDDLGISIKSSKSDEGTSGNYNPAARLMTIIKSHSGDTTAVHEMLHHLERMMPDEMQDAIKKAWLGKLVKARAKAEKAGKTDVIKFFDHALLGSTEKAVKSLRDSGEDIADFYQFTNPSEFWAVNGTNILHDRFGDQSVIDKIKTWLREAYQHIKAFFGLASDAPILRAIDNLLNNKDPSFIAESMLNENNDSKVLASLIPINAEQSQSGNKNGADENSESSGNPEENPESSNSLRNRAQAHVKNVGDWFGKFGALGSLPEQTKYLAMRYRTLGNLAKVEEISKDVYATFSKASKEDATAIYRYLTTRDATVDEIHSVDFRKAAKDIKQTIMAIGQQLVDRGFLDQQTYDKHEGAYLPRVYLKHILGDNVFSALGSGKSASDLGYLKHRKDIPEEVRRLILMEIKDPAYLTGRASNIPLRDIAIFDWFNQIADNKNWVWDQSYIKIGLNDQNKPAVLINSDGQGFNLYDRNNPGATKEEAIQTKRDRRFKIPTFKPIKVKPTMKIRKVTPFWMAKEAERMRRLAYAAPEADRADILATAAYFEFMANAAIKRMGEASEPKDFIQMPKSARYGALAGLIVRKEIHDDLIGTMAVFQGEPSIAQKILGDGGVLSKYTSLWKWAKVAANPPAQVRNIMSNLVLLQLSGVSFHKVPQRVMQAIDEIRNGGKHWNIAKQYGVTQSTFANTELFRMNRELNDLIVRNQDTNSWQKMKAVINFYAGRLVDKTGDLYQFMEAVGKVAKIIDEMEKGSTPEAAAIAAHEALFDYSLVQPSVRYLRNAPIGIPFGTFYIKALPQLVKVAVTHPERYLPYILMFKALSMLVAAQADVDDDDLDKLKLALPTFLQEKGHAYFLPWKDAEGRWQAMDFGYFVPWTMFAELGKQAARGDVDEALKTLGILGSPVADLIVAIKTGIDPFTQKPIIDKFGTPAGQLADVLTYLWRMNMPTFITDIGAAGKILENLTGQVDKQGDPKSTMGQALLRLGGVNIYGIDPEKTRAKNIRFKRFEMIEAKTAFHLAMQDRNLSDAKRQRIVAQYTKTITSMANDLGKYARDSEVNPKLKLHEGRKLD